MQAGSPAAERWIASARRECLDRMQADALAAYQRARAVLADELGLEPGEEIRDLNGRYCSRRSLRCTAAGA